jgi:nitrogen regulatory protein PII
MTRYHLKKRIDVILESPLLRTIARQLDRMNVSGYSVLPIIEGRGMQNAWTSEGQVSNTTNMVSLICIVDPSQADAVVDTVLTAVKERIGFVTLSDVYVIRPDRFSP